MAPQSELVREIASRAVPLKDLRPLIDRISRAKVVMLGEASHGTHEFYEWRRQISQILIQNYGFRILGVEGDWPSCQSMNRYIAPSKSHPPIQDSVIDLLKRSFKRWPTWMWANKETADLLDWIKGFNSGRSQQGQARFFGLDVYSLFDSIAQVIERLDRVNKPLADRARKHYACFDPFSANEEDYIQSLLEFPEGCQKEAVKVLTDLLQKRIDSRSELDEEFFDAQQNARIVRNAESYYRAMIFGNEDSWNVRDRHMMETLNVLLERNPENKAIVWAHNTHIGDYRATNMRRMGQVNIGGLAREHFGEDNVALVGFGTFQGTVIASDMWSGPITKMSVPPARDGSYENALHEAGIIMGIPNMEYYIILDQDATVKGHPLSEVRGNRAIGVVYHPKKERWGNYVPTSLARRYDAFVFIDETTALKPLAVQEFDAEVVPELFPSGV